MTFSPRVVLYGFVGFFSLQHVIQVYVSIDSHSVIFQNDMNDEIFHSKTNNSNTFVLCSISCSAYNCDIYEHV